VTEKSWSGISDYFSTNWNQTKEVATKVWGGVSAWFSKKWANVDEDTRKKWSAIGQTLKTHTPKQLLYMAWDKIGGYFSKKWEGVKKGISSAWGGIRDFFKSLNPIEWISHIWEKFREWFSSLRGKFGEWFIGLKEKFKEWGSSIITGFIDGIKEMFNDAVESVKNLGKAIGDKFRGILGIQSPSTVFAEYGINITRGLTGGIDRGSTGAMRTIEGLAMQGIAVAAPPPGGYAMEAMRSVHNQMTTNSSHVSNVDNSAFGGPVLHYAPVINITGSGGDDLTSRFSGMLNQHKGDIIRMFESMMANKRRLSFMN
jgi:hypothetical protein